MEKFRIRTIVVLFVIVFSLSGTFSFASAKKQEGPFMSFLHAIVSFFVGDSDTNSERVSANALGSTEEIVKSEEVDSATSTPKNSPKETVIVKNYTKTYTYYIPDFVNKSKVNKLQDDIDELKNQLISLTDKVYSAPQTYRLPIENYNISLAQRIDQLSNVKFTGGSINNTPIGLITPKEAKFTDLTVTNSASIESATASELSVTGTTTLQGALVDGFASEGTSGEVLMSTGTTTKWGAIGSAAVTDDSLDFADFKDALTLDATTTIAMPYPLNFDSGTLYIDSSNNRVGVGTTSPASNLHIVESGSPAWLNLESLSGNARFQLTNGNSNYYNIINIANDNSLRFQYNGS